MEHAVDPDLPVEVEDRFDPQLDPSALRLQRVDWVVLSLITLLVLVNATMHALGDQIRFAEAWNLYVAGVSPLWKSLREMAASPHPPVASLLHAPFLALSDASTLARIVSILAVAVQPWLWFGILRRLGIDRLLALASVAALMLSSTMTQLASTANGHIVATVFGLAAFRAFLTALPDGMPTVGAHSLRRRRGLALGLLAAAMAVGSAYSTLLALFALTAGMLFVTQFQRAFLRRTLERLAGSTRAIEWLLFFAAVAGTIAFYFATRFGGSRLDAAHWYPGPGQDIVGFAAQGLVHQLHTVTPLKLAGVAQGSMIAVALLGLLAVLAAVFARSPKLTSQRQALILASCVALTLTQPVLGWFELYPWGGAARHQVVFMLLLLASGTIALQALSRVSLPAKLQALPAAVFLGAALWTSTDPRFAIEREANSLIWSAEVASVFPAGDDTPVCITDHALHGIYAPHRYTLDMQFRQSFGTWDRLDAGLPRRSVFRPRYIPSFAAVPTVRALGELQTICSARTIDRIRVFSASPDGQLSIEAREQLRSKAAEACRAAGFTMLERKVWPNGETYLLSRILTAAKEPAPRRRFTPNATEVR